MQKYSPPNNEQQTTRDISIDDCVVLKYFFFENANRIEIENTIDVVIFPTVERKGQGIWRNVRYKKIIWIDNMNRSKNGRDFF